MNGRAGLSRSGSCDLQLLQAKITLLGETKGQPPVWLAPGNQRNDQQCLYAELTQVRPLIIRHRGIRIKSMNDGCRRVRKSGDTLFVVCWAQRSVVKDMR